MSTNGNSILEKIAKLMALGKSPNESEALNAIKMAQKLMSKYSIEQSEVDDLLGQMNSTFIKQVVEMNHARFKDWEKFLMMYISESNFCKVVFITGTDKIHIYGTKYDSEMVIALYMFVRPQMLDLANRAFKAAFSSKNGNEWKTSYYLGMNEKIHQLLKQVLQLTATEMGKNEIVLVKSDQVAKYYEENKGKVTTMKFNYDVNMNAYKQGYKDGDKLNLGIEERNKQIE